ncbi:MAG: hypothetical protein K0U98_05335 [Deltaproteobacteria bacterium]|nr:hypothetical protein [Deltaproteobacteria bacterium]
MCKKSLVLLTLFLAVPSLVLAQGVTTRSHPDFEGQTASPEDGGDTCPPGVMVAGPLPFVDSGDTCNGFTNTVSAYTAPCLTFSYQGEDTIYELTLAAGNNVSFSADLTGSTGDLAIFVIGTCGDGTSCVISSQDAIGPGAGPELIAAQAYTPGTYFVYIDSYYAAGQAGSCGTYELTVDGSLPAQLMGFSID